MKSTKNTLTTLITFFILLLFASAYIIQKYNHPSPSVENDRIHRIVKEYLLNNPEVIIDSLKNLEVKNANNYMENLQHNIHQKKDLIENVENSPSIGKADADITLVQFYDYRCGYCKKFSATLSELLVHDHKVKVIFKEFPILGEKSTFVSRIALAVNILYPEQFLNFHEKMMQQQKDITKETIKEALTQLSLDYDKILNKSQEEEVSHLLEQNRNLAREINVAGTPTVIINGDLVSNPYDLDILKAHIEKIRTSNKN